MAKGKLDFEGLKRQLHADIFGTVTRWIPGGKKEGPEYVVTNPTRPDMKRGSFKVNLRTGKWADFAVGQDGGDLISLYAYLKGIGNGEAYKELAGGNADFDYKKRDQQTKGPSIPDDVFEPKAIPLDAPPMPEPKGHPATYLYHDADGRVVMRVCIWKNRTTGNKITVPTSWGHRSWPKMVKQEDGKEEWNGEILEKTGWHNKSWPEKRNPYNLHLLTQRPEAVVVIGEGEKVADRLAFLGEGFVNMTWAGGSNAVAKTDWRAVTGRKVIITPDYDVAGHKAALEIAALLKQQECSVELVWEPLEEERHPLGWDVADEADDAKVRALIEGAISVDVVERLVLEADRMDGKVTAAGKKGGLSDSVPSEILNNQKDLKCLGYGGDNRVYFISRKRGVVVALSPEKLGNINHLLSLMPLEFWYQLFPDKKGGLDNHKCSDTMQRWADLTGFFTPDMIRGSGVWREANGDFVFHLGQKLLVGDQLVPINEYKSEYMYEATKDLGVKLVKPLGKDESRELIELCKFLDWEVPVFANLLAGFCMVAPICGGLDWRPHIWITGASGSGKSTAMTHIVRRACGKISLFVQGDSTSAGIRQTVGSDAVPVLFDEIEGESQARLLELQKVLDLARQSSSETGAMMVKGGAMGEALEFRVRSAFAFSAINVNVPQPADKSRISVLSLREGPKNLNEEKRDERFAVFEKYLDRVRETLSDDFVNALHMRAYAMLPIIRANAKVFGQAINAKLNNRRLGDQLGTLSAGCYALEFNEVATLDQAKAWVNAQDWESTVPLDDLKDHERCLSYILQSPVKMQGDRTQIERTLGEILEQVVKAATLDTVEQERVLATHGLRVDLREQTLMVANSHTALEKIFRGTPYSTWSRLLLRIEGAKSSAGPIRFVGGAVTRAVIIPLDAALRRDVRSALTPPPPSFKPAPPVEDLEIPFE